MTSNGQTLNGHAQAASLAEAGARTTLQHAQKLSAAHVEALKTQRNGACDEAAGLLAEVIVLRGLNDEFRKSAERAVEFIRDRDQQIEQLKAQLEEQKQTAAELSAQNADLQKRVDAHIETKKTKPREKKSSRGSVQSSAQQ